MANLFPTPLGFNGINLDNYFPNQRSYNSVVYVHKRLLANPKEYEKEANKDLKQKVPKYNDSKREKCDKGIQFDRIIQNDHVNKWKKTNVKTENDILLNHTVQFAKNLVPLIIPAENYEEPVFYTLKTKKTKKKLREYEKDLTYDTKKVKKIIDSPRKPKANSQLETLSLKGSASHSSQNTLNDFDINESLTCTISGISEKKSLKKDKESNKRKKCHNRKFTVSNSFEALATETLEANEGANIKIHLMNDTDKNNLSESLQIPIINAIKECITKFNQRNSVDSKLKEMHRYIKCNNEKLNQIVDKITCMEKQIESQMKKHIEVIHPPKVLASKSSKLEQLGEDLVELRDSMSEDEYTEVVEKQKTYKSTSVVATLDQNKDKDKRKKTLGGGEMSSPMDAVAEVPVQSDRPNRIPTRFCWTGVERS